MFNRDINLSDRKRMWIKIVIHISAIVLFILPELITNLDDNRPIPNGVIIKTILYLAIFYFNYFTVDYFLNIKKGRWCFLGTNCILLIIVSVIILFTSHVYTDNEFHPLKKPPHPHLEQIAPHSHTTPNGNIFEHKHPPFKESNNKFLHAAGRLSRDLLIAILTIALAFAIRVAIRWVESQRKQESIVASQREIELENLKSQINPHFLFNILNTIYALIEINQLQAQKAVHELSRMMRYAIYETTEMVTLKQEFDFLKSYISLMKMRINPNRPIEASLNCSNYCNYEIAPLLFIPIIENVFKYGNTENVTNPIKINITVKDGMVKCYTYNYFDKKKSSVCKDSGIGLSNLQRRLNIIYGENASFNFIKQDNTFQVELIIDLNNTNSKHK